MYYYKTFNENGAEYFREISMVDLPKLKKGN